MGNLSSLTWIGLLAGLAVTAVGFGLQLLGRYLFRRFGDGDTKEVAGVVGFRVSAIFGIAVGLIFAASAAYLIEAKRDLQEEVRLIATLKFLAAEAPTLQGRGKIEQSLTDFASQSLKEMSGPGGISESGRATSNLLIEICRSMALTDDDTDSVRWTKAEFQRSCGKLIDLRGKKRIGARETIVSTPFWVFFGVCFGFLAFLFGVFALSPINALFACIFYFATGLTGAIIYASGDPYHEPGRIDTKPLLLLLHGSAPKDASAETAAQD